MIVFLVSFVIQLAELHVTTVIAVLGADVQNALSLFSDFNSIVVQV